MTLNYKLSIVIPVYRGAQTLNDLYSQILKVLERDDYTFELIFVEDCGGDNSWDVIVELARKDSRVIGFQMGRNYGQHNALLCGILAATGDLIITMDDDLQHPPEELSKLLTKLDQGYDVVYGTPEKEPHGLFRGLASRVTKWVLQNAMGAQAASKVSAFRVFHTRLRDAFIDYRNPYVNIDVMLTWATTRFAAVTVRHDARLKGESGYTIKTLIRHALNMVTGFSTLPLQIASVTGLILALFGFFILIYVIVFTCFMAMRFRGLRLLPQ